MGIIEDMKTQSKTLPLRAYRALLVLAAAIWGLGFSIGKGAIALVGATWFTAFRFLGATVVLAVRPWPHMRDHFDRKLVKAGCPSWGSCRFSAFGRSS